MFPFVVLHPPPVTPLTDISPLCELIEPFTSPSTSTTNRDLESTLGMVAEEEDDDGGGGDSAFNSMGLSSKYTLSSRRTSL